MSTPVTKEGPMDQHAASAPTSFLAAGARGYEGDQHPADASRDLPDDTASSRISGSPTSDPIDEVVAYLLHADPAVRQQASVIVLAGGSKTSLAAIAARL